MTTSRYFAAVVFGAALTAPAAPALPQTPIPRPVVVTAVQETPTHVNVRFTICNVKSGLTYGATINPWIEGVQIFNGVAFGGFAAGMSNTNGTMMNPACPGGQEFNGGVQVTGPFSVIRKCGEDKTYTIIAKAWQGSTQLDSSGKTFTAYSVGPCPPSPSSIPRPPGPRRPPTPPDGAR